MAVKLTLAYKVNSQNKTNNTSNVTVTATASWTNGSWNSLGTCKGSITIDGTKYSFSGISFNSGHTNSGSQQVMTQTVNVKHNSDGTKKMSCSASFVTGTASGTIGASFSASLTTIPRKSSLSVANGKLGTKQTLTVAMASDAFTHTIAAKCGSASTTICTKSTSPSIDFTPPKSWASQNTTGTSVSVTYTITTYSGTTSIGSNSYVRTCLIHDAAKPSCTISVTDAMGYASTYGGYIKGLSKFKIEVTATQSYGSPIKTYKTTANGSTYKVASFTTAVLSSSCPATIYAEVTDARGRTSDNDEASKTVTLLDYSVPMISKLTVHRSNEDGTANDQGEFVKVVFSGSVTAFNKGPDYTENTATYKLEYKKRTEKTYTVIAFDDCNNQYAVSDKTYIFAADSGSSYDVRVVVTDNFGNGSKATTASTGFTIMHWLKTGLGMAIGKVAELENVLDIGFQTRFSGGILHPVLEPETDLNDVRTPNTYVGANVSSSNYLNCPITEGTFTLTVVGSGASGQVKQSIQTCNKQQSRTYERYYYTDTWGEWICVSDFRGTLLWNKDPLFMSGSHEVKLSEPISKQRNGIVLVFSRYSSNTVQNYHFTYHFVPKLAVSMHGGCGSVFYMGDVEGGYIAAKYLYIRDTTITGNDCNVSVLTDTNSGIKYTNNATVLRYVIGV